MEKLRILVALSGGVDSAVAAALLKDAGHEVIGITMNVWPELPDEAVVRADACCSLAAVDDARAVADTLDIPYYVLNLKNIFAERVIDNFYDEYARGRTPNPCVRCNQYIKFDALWPKARALNCDAIATGHYARILHDPVTGRYRLAKAVDSAKDQSYVLYTLDNEHLRRTLMPIGERQKSDVRVLARQFGLAVADKPESQEICFVHAGAYHEYVGRARPDAMRPGPMVDEQGAVVGTHRGIGAYTVGQRKGLGLANPEPTFVSRIDPSRNLLVVGPERLLYSRDVVAENLHFTSADRIEPGQQVQAKVRSRAIAADATVTARDESTVTVRFDQPMRAVTAGQALVMYDGDIVLGGGTIVSAA
jgi:tRNA-uridine 2-sulfurtransferase